MCSCIFDFIKRVGGRRWDARLCRASYRFPPTSLIHSIIQDSIYHMTIKLHLNLDFCIKTS